MVESGNQLNILVLGVGNAQVDLLRYLKGTSKVHACSYKRAGRGIDLADKFAVLDITQADLIREYTSQNNIEIVYSIGSDVAMPTVAAVSESLGLKCFIDSNQANICQNKTRFREFLKNCYGAVKYTKLDESLELNGITLPIIVKPADSQGQRGVQRVESIDGLNRAYLEALGHSRSNSVIAEEYIDGQEISVNAFIHNTKVIFSLPSDRVSWPHKGGGIIRKHILPCSVSKEGLNNVKRLVEETVSTLKLENGPVYFQIKMKGNQAKLIEVAPRLDGCHMWHLIKYATETDLLKMSVDLLLDKDVSDWTINEEVKGSWVLEFYSDAPEQRFNPEEYTINSNSVFSEFYYRPGEIVDRMNGHKEKVGYQIYRTE